MAIKVGINGFGRIGRCVFRAAVQNFGESIKLNPKEASAYFDRGIAYYEKQYYDRAVADFDQVTKIEPKNAQAYYNRGIAFADYRVRKVEGQRPGQDKCERNGRQQWGHELQRIVTQTRGLPRVCRGRHLRSNGRRRRCISPSSATARCGRSSRGVTESP